MSFSHAGGARARKRRKGGWLPIDVDGCFPSASAPAPSRQTARPVPARTCPTPRTSRPLPRDSAPRRQVREEAAIRGRARPRVRLSHASAPAPIPARARPRVPVPVRVCPTRPFLRAPAPAPSPRLCETLLSLTFLLCCDVAANDGFALVISFFGPKWQPVPLLQNMLASRDGFAKNRGRKRRFCRDNERVKGSLSCKTVVRCHGGLSIFTRALQKRHRLPFIVDYQKVVT